MKSPTLIGSVSISSTWISWTAILCPTFLRPAVVRTIDKLTESFLDVHLMLSEPEKYFDAFVKPGPTHNVSLRSPPPASRIRPANQEARHPAGISINPDMR